MTNDDQDPLGDADRAAATQPVQPPGPWRDTRTQRLRPPRAADAETQRLRRPGPAADGAGAADGQPAGRVPAGGGPAGGAPPHGEPEPGGEPEAEKNGKPPKKGSFWRELPVLAVIALAIALVIKTFVVQMFFIPSGSMQNTLEIGDRIMVNKLVYHFRSIQPGDIVVFNGDGSWDPEPPSAKPSSDPVVRLWDDTVDRLFHSFVGLLNGSAQDIFVKRVIGVPGDHVVCCNASGDVTINGVPLQEQSYLFPGNAPGSSPSPSQGHFSLTVPPGRLWVMGDHRAISDDSRLHTQDPGGGTIPESAVIGRAFVTVWPASRWHFLPIPSTFNQPGVDSPKSALAAPAALAGPTGALAGSAVATAGPGAPFLPLAGGFGAAVPLTWLQRRLRRRLLPRGLAPGLRRRRS